MDTYYPYVYFSICRISQTHHSFYSCDVDRILIYQFGFNDGHLSWVFYVAMIIFTVLILIADFMMNKYFVARFGGSKLGEYTALAGVILGCFVFPPFGIILGH